MLDEGRLEVLTKKNDHSRSAAAKKQAENENELATQGPTGGKKMI